jgi:large subunit ribosomal protein L11
MILPALITVFEDRSFTFIIKSPPVSVLLKKACGLAKASSNAKADKVGKVTLKQVREIAKEKMEDLNTSDMEMAIRSITGSARSMGIEVVED